MGILPAGRRRKVTGEVHSDSLALAIRDQRGGLVRRLEALPEDRWTAACPAPRPPSDVIRLDEPRRTVREMVAHLLLVDEMALAGQGSRAWRRMGRLEHPGAWDKRRIEPLACRPAAELIARLARGGDWFAQRVARLPQPVLRLPVAAPRGRVTVAELVARRVLHEWLHEQDIAAATGPETPTGSQPVLRLVSQAVLRLLPGEVLPRMDRQAGVVQLVVASAHKGQPLHRWGIDFSRCHYGPRVDGAPDAQIRLGADTLALLTSGRGDRLAGPRCATITGDEALGMAFLEALATPGTSAPCLGVGADAGATSTRIGAERPSLY